MGASIPNCYYLADLRRMAQDNVISEIIAEGSKGNGWHISFYVNGQKGYLITTGSGKLRKFAQPLSLYKLIDKVGLHCIITTTEFGMTPIATDLAAVFLVAQLNPAFDTYKQTTSTAAPIYLGVLYQAGIAEASSGSLQERVKNCLIDPTLFVSNICARIAKLSKSEQSSLRCVLTSLDALGNTHAQFKQITTTLLSLKLSD